MYVSVVVRRMNRVLPIFLFFVLFLERVGSVGN